MRKIFAASLISKLSLLVMTTGASTSSIITMALPDQTPSIISAGETEAVPLETAPGALSADDTEIIAISHSIVAVGPDAIPPSHEEVGAIDKPAEQAEPQAEWLATDAPLSLRISD